VWSRMERCEKRHIRVIPSMFDHVSRTSRNQRVKLPTSSYHIHVHGDTPGKPLSVKLTFSCSEVCQRSAQIRPHVVRRFLLIRYWSRETNDSLLPGYLLILSTDKSRNTLVALPLFAFVS